MSAHKGMYKLWHVHSVEFYNITAVKMYELVGTYIILKGFHNHNVECKKASCRRIHIV